MNTHVLDNAHLTISDVKTILGKKVQLSDGLKRKVSDCRIYLEKKIESGGDPIYGINTGFGILCDTVVSPMELGQLQENLVKSHACGLGDEVPSEVVKLMLLLKIIGLSKGHSGVTLKLLDRLIDMYNQEVLPVVYQQGSLGASGDLAPLAHLSLPLLGLGEVYWKGKKVAAIEVLKTLGWEPLELKAKEGLALLNGTQFMSAYAVSILLKATHAMQQADKVGALSLEAFDGRIEPFFPQLHAVRGHHGQIETAAAIRSWLEGSEWIKQRKKHVQDPYSFRCMPQVHGASKDAIQQAIRVIETEINSVTDNPTIFPEDDLVISGGNFHGQPLALSLDFLAISIAELGSISERRLYQLINGNRELPAFLVKNPGLNSGLMIAQYAAASVVSQNKQLCTPASVDTIDSSKGQEDHVSMGANAATKCWKVMENVESLLGIELLAATQAIEFRGVEKTSPQLKKWVKEYRKHVPFLEEDVETHVWMKKSKEFLFS